MAQSRTGVDPKLLEILVCPVTHGPLRYDAERSELVSERAGLAYPIRDGIPIMLVEEARKLDDGPGGATLQAPKATPSE
jgi:uncharacterized protein YbaR (Trm112 family)